MTPTPGPDAAAADDRAATCRLRPRLQGGDPRGVDVPRRHRPSAGRWPGCIDAAATRHRPAAPWHHRHARRPAGRRSRAGQARPGGRRAGRAAPRPPVGELRLMRRRRRRRLAHASCCCSAARRGSAREGGISRLGRPPAAAPRDPRDRLRRGAARTQVRRRRRLGQPRRQLPGRATPSISTTRPCRRCSRSPAIPQRLGELTRRIDERRRRGGRRARAGARRWSGCCGSWPRRRSQRPEQPRRGPAATRRRRPAACRRT